MHTGPGTPRVGGVADRGRPHHHLRPASDATEITWTPLRSTISASLTRCENGGRAPCGMPELAEHDEAEAVEPKVAGGRGEVPTAWR